MLNKKKHNVTNLCSKIIRRESEAKKKIWSAYGCLIMQNLNKKGIEVNRNSSTIYINKIVSLFSFFFYSRRASNWTCKNNRKRPSHTCWWSVDGKAYAQEMTCPPLLLSSPLFSCNKNCKEMIYETNLTIRCKCNAIEPVLDLSNQ